MPRRRSKAIGTIGYERDVTYGHDAQLTLSTLALRLARSLA